MLKIITKKWLADSHKQLDKKNPKVLQEKELSTQERPVTLLKIIKN